MDTFKRVGGFWLIWTGVSLGGVAITVLGLLFLHAASHPGEVPPVRATVELVTPATP